MVSVLTIGHALRKLSAPLPTQFGERLSATASLGASSGDAPSKRQRLALQRRSSARGAHGPSAVHARAFCRSANTCTGMLGGAIQNSAINTPRIQTRSATYPAQVQTLAINGRCVARHSPMARRALASTLTSSDASMTTAVVTPRFSRSRSQSVASRRNASHASTVGMRRKANRVTAGFGQDRSTQKSGPSLNPHPRGWFGASRFDTLVSSRENWAPCPGGCPSRSKALIASVGYHRRRECASILCRSPT